MSKIIPPPVIKLASLELGDQLRYTDNNIDFVYIVTDKDEERDLPIVEIIPKETQKTGSKIREELGAAVLTGVLLGSGIPLIDRNGKGRISNLERPDELGLIKFGPAITFLAVEMSFGEETGNGIFPAPLHSPACVQIVRGAA